MAGTTAAAPAAVNGQPQQQPIVAVSSQQTEGGGGGGAVAPVEEVDRQVHPSGIVPVLQCVFCFALLLSSFAAPENRRSRDHNSKWNVESGRALLFTHATTTTLLLPPAEISSRR